MHSQPASDPSCARTHATRAHAHNHLRCHSPLHSPTNHHLLPHLVDYSPVHHATSYIWIASDCIVKPHTTLCAPLGILAIIPPWRSAVYASTLVTSHIYLIPHRSHWISELLSTYVHTSPARLLRSCYRLWAQQRSGERASITASLCCIACTHTTTSTRHNDTRSLLKRARLENHRMCTITHIKEAARKQPHGTPTHKRGGLVTTLPTQQHRGETLNSDDATTRTAGI